MGYSLIKSSYVIYQKINNNLPDNNKGRDSIHIWAPNKEDQIDLEKQTSIQHTCPKNLQRNKVHKINCTRDKIMFKGKKT